MKEEILKMLKALKAIKIPISKVEADLGFSNGLVGKASKGTTELSSEKFEKLKVYFKQKINPADLNTSKTTPADTKMMVVDKSGIKEVEKKIVATDSMEKINKDFGDGTIMFFGSKPNKGYEVVSTGSLGLDVALGIGGFPRGRIIEIFGWESSGKTTIALNVIANAQKKGLRCLLVDAENAFDPEYAEALGVKVDELQYCQPSCGEQGLEVADRQMTKGEADVVVVDSVAALIPKAELEGVHGDSKMGLHARLMSQACRKLAGVIANKNCICIFINQLRHKMVTMGNPEVTTGGNALQFYASIRVEVRRSTTIENSIMNGDIKEGNKTTVKVIKNKCAPPFRQAVFNIIYGKGVDRLGEVIDLAIEKKIIKQSGSWFSYGEHKFGQGKPSVYEILEGTPELREEIEKLILI